MSTLVVIGYDDEFKAECGKKRMTPEMKNREHKHVSERLF